MQPAIDAIIAHVRPKINALLRTRGFYDHANMFAQYKTHIWGHIPGYIRDTFRATFVVNLGTHPEMQSGHRGTHL